MSHQAFMHAALLLAERNLGQTWPNPAVGAIIVHNGQIVGRGYTQRGGRPHAETEALKQAGEKARGATLYVSLEPCAHQGQTPPCTSAVIATGIKTVVIACADPNPKVSGQGAQQLKDAGIEVVENICSKEARELNRGFFSSIEKKRPYIALKIATSLDGKIATRSGQSKWITGERARNYGHLLRSRHDAIVTGSGTVLADDPELTCRLPGLEQRSPVRVIIDRSGRVQSSAKIFAQQDIAPTWHLREQTIDGALAALTAKGITRVLVEAGATLSTAFLQSGRVDSIYWFKSPLVIGDDGRAAMGKGFAELADLKRYTTADHIALGNDTLDILACSPA